MCALLAEFRARRQVEKQRARAHAARRSDDCAPRSSSRDVRAVGLGSARSETTSAAPVSAAHASAATTASAPASGIACIVGGKSGSSAGIASTLIMLTSTTAVGAGPGARQINFFVLSGLARRMDLGHRGRGLVNPGARCDSSSMTRRLRVGVVFGGRSGEHEVSLRSAWAVIGALDPARYEVVPVAIGRDGRWRTSLDMLRMLDEAQRELGPIPESGVEVAIPPDPARRALVPVAGGNPVPLDVVFPVLHGTYGEDGTIQGLLELADVPYVGAGVLGSAAGMDKAVMKALFRDAGLPVCRSVVLAPGEVAEARVAAELGFPCFVKPANLGSSVGISKVAGPDELGAAVAEAREYDAKVVVEEAVDAREFECGVLGNDELEASVV